MAQSANSKAPLRSDKVAALWIVILGDAARAAEAKADGFVFFKGVPFVRGIKRQPKGVRQRLGEMAAETTFGKLPERKLVQTPRSAVVSQRFLEG